MEAFRAILPNRQRLYLVDTPGFDDDNREDTDILYDLSDWLSRADERKIQLTGIVYLHRITDNRLGHQAKKNLRMFKALCGEDGLKSVVLATTHWPEGPFPAGEDREVELRTDPNKWGEMIYHGSTVMRVYQDERSVWDILRYLINLKRRVTMEIQKELRSDMKLKDTAAGKELKADFEEQVQEFERKLEDVKRRLHQAFDQENKEREERLSRQKAEIEEKLAKAEQRWASDRRKLEANADDVRRWREQEIKNLSEEIKARDLQIQEAMKKLAQTRTQKEHDAKLRDAEIKLKISEVERTKLEAGRTKLEMENENLQKEVRKLKQTLRAVSANCEVM